MSVNGVTIMSSYSSLDHGPGFPVHFLPSIQQSIKEDPLLMGLNYQQDEYCRGMDSLQNNENYKDYYYYVL